MKRILSLCRHDLHAHKQAFFLLVLLTLTFLLRFPSLFEPYWYGDEGIYQVVGKGIASGRLLYQEIWDNKPPVLYLIYAFVNGDLFHVRLLANLVALGTVAMFFFLAKLALDQKRAVYISSILFALLFGLPILEGNIANAENFMLLPIMLAAYFILAGMRLFLVGLLLSLAFLIKPVAFFDIAAFITVVAFQIFPKNYIATPQNKKFLEMWKAYGKKLFAKIRPMLVGIAVPILTVLFVFWAVGALSDFMSAVFFQSVPYISYENQFFIPQGFLLIKLLLLTMFLLLVFFRRNVFTKTQQFSLIWFAFCLFNVFFANRPYTHYLLLALPSFCLLIGETIKSEGFRKQGLVIALASIILILQNFWIYDKIIPYYQNFIEFVSSPKDVEQYQGFFDENVPRDYEVAEFIKLHTNDRDKIFIWGNSAQIYVLSNKLPPGRLSVAYHVTFFPEAFNETKQAISQSKPKYVVLLTGIGEYHELIAEYRPVFTLSKGAIIYEREH